MRQRSNRATKRGLPPLETRVSPAIYEQWFGRAKRPPPRQCVDERYLEADGYYGPRGEEGRRPDYTVKEWRFYYSDGTTETLTMREPVK